MKKFLLNSIKSLFNPPPTIKINKIFNEVGGDRKLLFNKLKKSQDVLLANKLVTVYTVPVSGCEDPSKFQKEIIKALREYFYKKKLNNWSFYAIENNEVKVCKF